MGFLGIAILGVFGVQVLLGFQLWYWGFWVFGLVLGASGIPRVLSTTAGFYLCVLSGLGWSVVLFGYLVVFVAMFVVGVLGVFVSFVFIWDGVRVFWVWFSWFVLAFAIVLGLILICFGSLFGVIDW